MLAAATLALFLLWRGSAAEQIEQLRSQVSTAQTTAASSSADVSELTQRMDGASREVTSLEALVGSYTFACSTGPYRPERPGSVLLSVSAEGLLSCGDGRK
jgi:hypothetical protein